MINLSETIEITQVTTNKLSVQPKWQVEEDEECEIGGGEDDEGYAPIMCDDDGPDFKLFKDFRKGGEGGELESGK